jgi:hypothetical protein
MKFSFAQASCCVTLTLGILMGLDNRANAASIVQGVTYHLAEHGTNYGYYDQFNPNLGTLLDVMIQCQGEICVSDAFEFINLISIFSNHTPVDQTFTGSVNFRENTDGGSTNGSNSFTLTLAPGQYVNEGVSGAYDLSTTYGNNPFWVGTRVLRPDSYYNSQINFSGDFSLSASSNNPNIFIDSAPYGDPYAFASDTGTETVTYLYQPAGYVPEPPAGYVPEPPTYMMLGTACLLLLAVRYSLRGFARPDRIPG